MGLFVSYSSQDRSAIDPLTTALRRARQQVWFDDELGGGEAWWKEILDPIRSCEVFIVALSNHLLESKPCQAELRYAQALQRPILPVRIGPVDTMRANPLASLQVIDYQNPSVDTGIQLVTEVHALAGQPRPLPSPLPDEPAVPFAYLMRLSSTLAEQDLDPRQQTHLLTELKSGLEEDGDDPTARNDISRLLRMLRDRSDVTYRTRTEIDNLLASVDAKSAAPPALLRLGLRSADPPKRVFAGAVEFPSAESAHAFVRTSAGNWKACAGQTVTVAHGNQTTPWTFSELNGAPPRIMQRRAQAVPNGRVCQRVLSAVSRVVIDVVACRTSITNEAGQVVDQMAAKVTP
jgi:hypothetical protein